ncbi:RHS repeat-associated core domain-containing protein [Shewanella colwelliana]|nr:RHS repeat-associated core domain-containing protein [Shewanella colwelliana]
MRNGTTSTFSYDANGNRYKQVKKTGSVTTTTYYVGSFEREVTLSSTIDKTYIGDHTIKMKAHIGSLGNQSPFQHVLRDRLGSVDTLVDGKTAAVLQHRGYDVFGRPRDIAAGNNLLASWQGVTKGYTDHEHLNEQQLIHMNGRVYDYNVGRFLSVDPFLQFPENSQSANPYSYILNNPMSGVDPTGYITEITMCPPKPTCDAPKAPEDRSGDKNKSRKGKAEKEKSKQQGKPNVTSGKINITVWGQKTAKSKDVGRQLSHYGDLSQSYQLPNFVKDMARFCDVYPCRGSGEIESSLFFDDLLGLGLKSMIFLPMRAVGTHADDLITTGIRLPSFPNRGSFNLLNKTGRFYPNIPDLRTGKSIIFPTGHLQKVAKSQRVSWGAQERGAFIKQSYDRGYKTPRGGWAEYDIHHIRPREFGGSNDFWNLAPIQRRTHQQEFNSFWRDM